MITASRRIHAPAAQVWDVLADLDRYRDWNPWLQEAHGSIAPGEYLSVTARFGTQGGTYRHRMVAAERPSLFHWEDVGAFTLFAKGERIRHIEAVDDNRCDYCVDLRISGLLSRLALRFYGDFLRGGLNAETAALQQRAEALAQKNSA